jgi:hypothetical protein
LKIRRAGRKRIGQNSPARVHRQKREQRTNNCKWGEFLSLLKSKLNGNWLFIGGVGSQNAKGCSINENKREVVSLKYQPGKPGT